MSKTNEDTEAIIQTEDGFDNDRDNVATVSSSTGPSRQLYDTFSIFSL